MAADGVPEPRAGAAPGRRTQPCARRDRARVDLLLVRVLEPSGLRRVRRSPVCSHTCGRGMAREGRARRGTAWPGKAGAVFSGKRNQRLPVATPMGVAGRGEAGQGKARHGEAWQGRGCPQRQAQPALAGGDTDGLGWARRGGARHGMARQGRARAVLSGKRNQRLPVATPQGAARRGLAWPGGARLGRAGPGMAWQGLSVQQAARDARYLVH